MWRNAYKIKMGYGSYVLINFSFYFTMAAFSSVLPVYLTGIGKNSTEIAQIVSASSLFSLAVVPAAGIVSDQTGSPRRVSGVLMVMTAILSLVFAGTKDTWMLFLLNGLIASFIGALQPLCERIISGSGHRYGSLRVFGTFGYAAGAQAAGIVLQAFPPKALFILVTFMAFLSTAGYALSGDPIDIPAATENPQEKPRFAAVLKNPQFLLFALIALLFWSCSGANMTYCPLLLAELGMPTGFVGTILSIGTLVEIPLIVFSHKYMDRFSGKALIISNCMIALTQYTIYGVSGSLAVSATAMVLLKAVSSTLFSMLILKMVRNLVPPELTSTSMAFITTTNSLGAIVMQLLAGNLVSGFGIHTLYLFFASVMLLTAFTALALKLGTEKKVFA